MSSQPSAARRRFHRDRVIAKRLNQAARLSLTDPAEFTRGRLANHQHYVGCHRPRCGVCHPDKCWPNGDRQRENREWREAEAAGDDAEVASYQRVSTR